MLRAISDFLHSIENHMPLLDALNKSAEKIAKAIKKEYMG